MFLGANMRNKGGDTGFSGFVAVREYLACYWTSLREDHVIYYIITRRVIDG